LLKEVVVREGIRVREIRKEEGQRLPRIVRRSSGSVVTWRRAQMVLLLAQGMNVAQIAKVAFTSEDRVRAVLHNFNDDAFESLYPQYAGGRPPTVTFPQRQAIKKIALARPQDHDLPFSTWSLSKLAGFLAAEGVVDDVSHEGLRVLLPEEGVSSQVIKTFKASNDPDYEAKKNRGPRALRHRRRQSPTRPWRSDGRVLHGRVRAAQPATPPRQAVGPAGRRQRRLTRPPAKRLVR
jgi:transposase